MGVIRWDDWYNTSASPTDSGRAIEAAMSLPAWQGRSPAFCDLVAGNITCNNNQQSVVDAEIALAVAAGLDYFAFDQYPDTTELAVPRLMFKASTSPLKPRLRFCHLLQTGWISAGGLPAWPAQAAYFAADFAREDYMKVPDAAGVLRPLVHLFSVYEGAWGPGGWAAWDAALSILANASLAAGQPAPYIALQDFTAGSGWASMSAINGGRPKGEWLVQALSSYAIVGGAGYPVGGPYSALAAANAAFWDAAAATGADVIPPITAGWDPRPMNQSHLPWQNFTDPAWVEQPTPAELAGLLSAALAWTAAHPAANPTATHLISAFNEHAEGHWIAPTLAEGNARLEAIAGVLGHA